MSQLSVNLPPGWDSARDLVVVCGAGALDAARALAQHGVARVLAVAAGPAPAGVMVGDREGVIVAACGALQEPVPERIVYLEHGPPTPGLPALEQVKRWVDRCIQQVHTNHGTHEFFGMQWAQQTTANLPSLLRATSVAALDGAFVGRPMVVVCPGPSLGRSLEELRALQGRAVIVAVQHALVSLQRAGIVPDLAIAYDPQDLRHHFHGVELERLAGVVLEVGVHPSLFDLGQRHTLAYAANADFADWIAPVFGAPFGRLAAGGSVTHAAVSLGIRWRCAPIVGVGMDLAYPGGRMYTPTAVLGDATIAQGAGEHAVIVEERDGVRTEAETRLGHLFDVPGWDGEPVLTSHAFHTFRLWLEDLAAAMPRVTLVNTSEGGAFVRGWQHRRLADVVEALRGGPPVDVAAAVARAPRAGDTPDHARRARALLEARRKGFEEARALAQRCGKLIERGGASLRAAVKADAEGRTPARRDLVELQKLEQSEARLIAVARGLENLVLAMQGPIRQAQRAGATLTPAQKLDAKLALYRAVADTSLALVQTCDGALARLPAAPPAAPG